MGGSEKRVLVGVRLPVRLVRALKLAAVQEDTTVQALVEVAVRALLGLKREGGRRGTQ